MNLSFLVLSWALTLGFIPSETTLIGTGTVPVAFCGKTNALKQTIEIGVTAFDLVTIWTNIETYDTMISPIQYSPFRSDYNIGLNVGHSFDGLRLDAGVNHECIHPVYSNGLGKWVAGGNTEVYVKVSGAIGGK